MKEPNPPKAFRKNKSASFSSDGFKERADVDEFDPTKSPIMARCNDCNDDLSLGCFQKSSLIWGGSRKKGVSPAIENAEDYLDRIDQASNATFPLGMDLPVPQEVQESMNWLANTDPSEILPFRTEQIDRLMMLVSQCAATQEQWRALCPPEIRCCRRTLAQRRFTS